MCASAVKAPRRHSIRFKPRHSCAPCTKCTKRQKALVGILIIKSFSFSTAKGRTGMPIKSNQPVSLSDVSWNFIISSCLASHFDVSLVNIPIFIPGSSSWSKTSVHASWPTPWKRGSKFDLHDFTYHFASILLTTPEFPMSCRRPVSKPSWYSP